MMDRLSRSLPYVGLVLAAGLVVLLAWQKRDLLTRYDELNRNYRKAITELRPGQFVPAFQTATLEGQPVTVGELPQEGRQVLLVYTVTCQYCKSTIPAWKQITSAVDTMTSVRARVYGVSLSGVDSTRQYVAQHQLPYPTVRFPNEKLESMYRASSVPLTLVIDEQGRTVYSRLGEIRTQAAIDSVLTGVKFKPQPPAQPNARPGAQPAAAAQPQQTASR